MSVQALTGAISELAQGHRRATAASSLLDGLLAYYTLDELSGTRVDQVAGLDLTPDTDADTAGDGKIGSALRTFGTADPTASRLTRAGHDSLRFGDGVTREFVFWFRESPPSPVNGGILGCDSPAGRDFAIRSGNRILTMLYFDLAGNPYTIDYNGLGGYVQHTPGDWHLGFVGFDLSAGRAFMRVDDGAFLYGADVITGIKASSQDFVVGGLFFYHSGDMDLDELAVYGRVLSEDDRALLWNSGAGTTYPFA